MCVMFVFLLACLFFVVFGVVLVVAVVVVLCVVVLCVVMAFTFNPWNFFYITVYVLTGRC